MKEVHKKLIIFYLVLLLAGYVLPTLSNWNLDPKEWATPTTQVATLILSVISLFGSILIITSE